MLGLVERVVDDAVLMKREGGGGRVSQPIDAAVDKSAANVAICGLDVGNV